MMYYHLFYILNLYLHYCIDYQQCKFLHYTNNNLHIYEELRNNLKYLKENIRRYGSKIKFISDEYDILNEYDTYYTNNELYMIDIYNELGKGYNPDSEIIKNITEIFIIMSIV